MTRLPTPLHRPYRAAARTFTPQSVGALALWYPIDGRIWTDSARTTAAGAGDPVGARDDYSGNAKHLLQATTLKKPTFSASGPGIQYDGVDDLMTVTYALSPASQFAIMMAIWGKDGSDAFKTVALNTFKPTLVTAPGSSEYGIELGDGAVFERDLPANFQPGVQWAFPITFVPVPASNDGLAHTICELRKDASNTVKVRKLASGDIELSATVAGVVKTPVTLTPSAPWTAGTIVFAGLQFDGTAATVHFATTGATTLQTASIGSFGTLAAGTYTFCVGAQSGGAEGLPGVYNVLGIDSNSAAAITTRFAAGAWLDIATYLQTTISGDSKSLAQRLVIYINGDASSVKIGTYQGATDALAGTATGRLDLNGTTQYVNFGNVTALNSAQKFWVLVEVERDTIGVAHSLFSRWDQLDVTKQQFRWIFGTSNQFAIRMGDGAGNDYTITSNNTFVAGWRGLALLRVDLTAATDALRVKIDTAAYDATTRKYGAWTSQALAFGGAAAPASLISVATLNLYSGAIVSGAGVDLLLDGKLDTLAWCVESTAFAATIPDSLRDTMTAGEIPFFADHGYLFEGDANDVATATAINGTLVGSPAYVDDSRQHIGRLEKYSKRGALAYRGAASINVDFGTPTGLDGARSFTAFGVFTPGYRHVNSTNTLLSVWDGADASKRQFYIVWEYNTGAVRLKAGIADSSGSEKTGTTPDGSLVQGTKYAYIVRFDGNGVGNSGKLRIWLAAFDRTTGLYGALTEQTLTFVGTIPSSLNALAGSTKMYQGRFNDGQAQYFGLIDDTRLWINDALDPTALTSLNVYQERGWSSATVRAPDRWWTNDNTGNDRTFGGSRGGGGTNAMVRPTFARASTVGGQLYSDGVIRSVASGELRNKYWFQTNDGVDRVAALIQRALTNVVSTDDLTAWSKFQTPTVTSGISDPKGGTGAYRITNSDGLGQSNVFKDFAFTGDGVKSIVFVVRQGTMPATGRQEIGLYDSTGAATKVAVGITGWVSGKPTAAIVSGFGTLLGVRPIGNGYWGIYCKSLSIIAANNNHPYIMPAQAAGNATASIDVYRVNEYNSALPLETILDASGAAVADNLSFGNVTPQALTLVWEGALCDIPSGGDYWAHIVNIGAPDTAATGGFGIYLDKTSTQVACKYMNKDTGVSVNATVTPSVALTRYDRLRVLATLTAAGVAQVSIEVNGGSVQAGPTTAANGLSGTSWSDTAVHVGYATPTTLNQPIMGVTQIKVNSAVKTLPQMDAINKPDLAHYQVGMQTADVDGTLNSPIHWYDGRQPTGYTFDANIEVDRATGTNQVNGGTYGLRVKAMATDGARVYFNTASIAAGTRLVFGAYARATAGAPDIRAGASGAFTSARPTTIPVQATLTPIGRFETTDATGVASIAAVHTNTAGDEAYVDSIQAIAFASLSATTASVGIPTRVIASATKSGFTGPYVFVGIGGTEKVRIGYRNDAGNIGQAESAGSVTIAPHSLSLEFDGTTLRAYVDTVLVVSLAVTGSFTGLDTVVLGGFKTTAESRSFDERIGDAWLHSGRVYSAIERKRLHNDYLVPRTTGLAAA